MAVLAYSAYSKIARLSPHWLSCMFHLDIMRAEILLVESKKNFDIKIARGEKIVSLI